MKTETDMDNKEKYLVAGIGGQGVRIVDQILSRGSLTCDAAVCDTDDRTLACSVVKDKYILEESTILDKIVYRAKTFIPTAVLGGSAGNTFLPAICQKARECGANVFPVVALSPRSEDSERAAAALSELRKALPFRSIYVIDPQKISQAYDPQPRQSELMEILRISLAEKTLFILRHRMEMDSALERLPRLLDELESFMAED